MKVAVIGSGYVGLCTGACLAEVGHDVTCLDNDRAKIARLQAGGCPIYEPGLPAALARNVAAGRLRFADEIARPVAEADVVFLCVGTPPTPSGRADLSFIEQVTRELARHLQGYTVVVEKSTVPVATGDKIRRVLTQYLADPTAEFDVASNPEFLAEGTAMQDAMAPSRIVVGVSSPRAEETLRRLYAPLAAAPFIATDLRSAELIKHASNSFLAAKISFINAVSVVCELAGADVEQVAHGMGLDPRIGPRFLQAGIGYGGSCFPKDVDAFGALAEELGYPFRLLGEVQEINRDQLRRFLRKISDELWHAKGKAVAVLGLAFKPDTDDLRHAPALGVLDHLLEHGAQVCAFDPVAVPNARRLYGDRVRFETDPYAALRDAECALILTEWRAIRALDLDRVRTLMRLPLIIDGRNLWPPEELARRGFTYVSMGRPRVGPPLA